MFWNVIPPPLFKCLDLPLHIYIWNFALRWLYQVLSTNLQLNTLNRQLICIWYNTILFMKYRIANKTIIYILKLTKNVFLWQISWIHLLCWKRNHLNICINCQKSFKKVKWSNIKIWLNTYKLMFMILSEKMVKFLKRIKNTSTINALSSKTLKWVHSAPIKCLH